MENKKINGLFVFTFFTLIFVSKVSLGMNNNLTKEEVKKAIAFFWRSKSPWLECAKDTIECKTVNKREEKLIRDFSIVKCEHEFFSKMYPGSGIYVKDKIFLKDNITGQKVLLKSFPKVNNDGNLLVVYFNGTKRLIDKNTGKIIGN